MWLFIGRRIPRTIMWLALPSSFRVQGLYHLFARRLRVQGIAEAKFEAVGGPGWGTMRSTPPHVKGLPRTCCGFYGLSTFWFQDTGLYSSMAPQSRSVSSIAALCVTTDRYHCVKTTLCSEYSALRRNCREPTKMMVWKLNWTGNDPKEAND